MSGHSVEEYKSMVSELRLQLEERGREREAMEAKYEAQLTEMARKHQGEAALWDDERAQLTDLIQDTMERQKEFNEQLLSQRGAWDEMAAIKAELEIEN